MPESDIPEEHYILVMTTCNQRTTARRIADGVVEQRLAACVNVLAGIESVYAWQGKIEHDEEILLVMKARASHYAQLEQAIKALHDYELPEIIAVPIDTGSAEYLNWIKTVTG